VHYLTPFFNGTTLSIAKSSSKIGFNPQGRKVPFSLQIPFHQRRKIEDPPPPSPPPLENGFDIC
jgi:hypothetical protein